MTGTHTGVLDDRALARFTAKFAVDPISNCWLWTAVSSHGYGRFWYEGRHRWAHRVAYEHFISPIEDGLQLDHRCRVPACVNPAHLEPVTNAENQRRGVNGFALTGLCRRGLHSVTDPANVYIDPDGDRACRVCARDYARNQQRTIRRAARALGMTRDAYVARHGYSLVTAEAFAWSAGIQSTLDFDLASPTAVGARPP